MRDCGTAVARAGAGTSGAGLRDRDLVGTASVGSAQRGPTQHAVKKPQFSWMRCPQGTWLLPFTSQTTG